MKMHTKRPCNFTVTQSRILNKRYRSAVFRTEDAQAHLLQIFVEFRLRYHVLSVCIERPPQLRSSFLLFVSISDHPPHLEFEHKVHASIMLFMQSSDLFSHCKAHERTSSNVQLHILCHAGPYAVSSAMCKSYSS